MKSKTAILVLGLTAALSAADPGFAQIYKYQDERGQWHFSDRPPAGQEQAVTAVAQPAADKTAGKDLKASLYEKHPPQTPVQEATLGTVMIKTPLGSGSGFFVSEAGHILTNRHVITPNENQLDEVQVRIAETERQLTAYRERLAVEDAQLKKRQKDLADYETYVRSLREGPRKQEEQANYQLLLKQYRQWDKDISQKRREFREKQAVFETEQREFNWKRNVAGSRRQYTVVLKDGTELNAYRVAVSGNHDLALLQLDGFRTPQLKAATRLEIGQGMRVFALGNPIGIHDSISAGVVSGFEGNFVRTDAKIYPGNSGGPLVLEDGRVVGINTMKRITHQFEGLGYAIDIDTALQEFTSHLRGE
jgi:S1-C subfamily serine protease